jgi:hypothetical protein
LPPEAPSAVIEIDVTPAGTVNSSAAPVKLNTWGLVRVLEVCACTGNITESTTGLLHDSGRLLPAITAPLPAAIDFSSLRRDWSDILFPLALVLFLAINTTTLTHSVSSNRTLNDCLGLWVQLIDATLYSYK